MTNNWITSPAMVNDGSVPEDKPVYYTRSMLDSVKRIIGAHPSNDDYKFSSHLRAVISRKTREDTIEQCIRLLKRHEFDTFAFSGISGMGMGFILAHLMGKEVIVARKPGESHQAWVSYPYEGYLKAEKYVIVDDLVASGTTSARVFRAVRDLAPQAKLTGILLYLHGPNLVGPGETDWYQVQATVRNMDERVAAGQSAEDYRP